MVRCAFRDLCAGCSSLSLLDHVSQMLFCKPSLSFSKGFLQRLQNTIYTTCCNQVVNIGKSINDQIAADLESFWMFYQLFDVWQGRKLLVIGTSSADDKILESMSLLDTFNVHLNVPNLKPSDMKQVLEPLDVFDSADTNNAINSSGYRDSNQEIVNDD
jgi:hypothetical protein